MKKTLTIGIIGGGAAGMMCAATILENQQSKLAAQPIKIHIFDKNTSLGVKVAITGGGRCNVTTGINNIPLLLTKYIRGANFFKATLSAFPPSKVRAWFEEHGVALKEEVDGRVFPASDKGQDIIKVFEDLFEDKRVQLHLSEPVLAASNSNDNAGFTVTSKKAEYNFDKLVITTGGSAYQQTGSTGDGYTLAQSFGHSITRLGPSLNSFTTAQEWCHALSGISLPEARFEFTLADGQKRSVIGPMIFTHFGISGPAVFTMAAHLAFEELTADKPLAIKLIPNPTITFDQYDAKIVLDIKRDGLKPIALILMQFVPRRLADTILLLADVQAETGAELTREERLRIVHILADGLKLTLISRMAGAEFVTAGGINLEEIDRKTMQSKLVQGLFFAGEVVNIDGLTGGFNLQVAWATGRAAGNSIIQPS